MDERSNRRSRVREAALLRTARVKRWVAGGALALTGIFSAIAAAVLPASHASSGSAAPSSPAPTQPAIPSSDGESGGDSQPESQSPSQSQSQSQSQSPSQQAVPNIAPPVDVPQPSNSGGGAVSGGS